jgi:hypothetical protein
MIIDCKHQPWRVLRSRPRWQLMALKRWDIVIRTVNDNIPTFQLQNQHGRRERKRSLGGATTFEICGAETLGYCLSYYERQYPNVSARKSPWSVRTKTPHGRGFGAATRGNMRVFVSHFLFDGRRKHEIRRNCTTQIFKFGANYFLNKARLACSITIATRERGRRYRLPNIAG